MWLRNTPGQVLGFNMVLQEDGSPATGLVLHGQRVIDSASAEPIDGTIVEEGHGQYVVRLAAADTDGRQVSIILYHDLAVAQEKTFSPFDVGDVAQLVTTVNANGTTIDAGQPVALNAIARGVLASAAAGGRLAFGVATSTAADGAPLSVLATGLFTLADWSNVVGSTGLVAGDVYYLDHTAGRLVTAPPSSAGDQFQPVGLAVALQTLYVFPPGQLGIARAGMTGVYNDLLHKPGTQTESGADAGFLDILKVLGVQPVLLLKNPASPNPAAAARLISGQLRLELQNAPAGNACYLYLASDAGKAVAFLDSFSPVSGHRDSYFAVVDATGTLRPGQYWTAPDGTVYAGGLMVTPGGGGAPALASGTYTPTLTDQANTGAATVADAQWSQVGDVVTVSGTLTVTPPAALTPTAFNLDLPMPSAFASAGQAAGAGLATPGPLSQTLGVQVLADVAAGQALFTFTPSAAPFDHFVTFTFTYLVV